MEIQGVEDALCSMSEDFRNKAAERAQDASFTYLIQQGIPSHPADVVMLSQTMFQAGIAWARAAGFVEFAEGAVASEAEQEAVRKRMAQARDQENLLAEALAGRLGVEPAAPGNYL